jgi:hypothetical protein
MEFDQIQALRIRLGERRSKALALLLNECVSKSELRRFVEHYCDRLEIDSCSYSYESMLGDALEQLDIVYETAIRVLDLAIGILELGRSLTEATIRELQALDRPMLRLRCSHLDQVVAELDGRYYFWLAVYEEDFTESSEV